MQTRNWITMAVVAGCALGGAAMAQDKDRPERGGDRPHPPALKEMDTNNDGKVTYEEFLAFHEKRIKERFDRLDRNGDGVISRDDRPAGGGGGGGGEEPAGLRRGAGGERPGPGQGARGERKGEGLGGGRGAGKAPGGAGDRTL